MPISLDFLYANQAQLSVTQADELVRMKFSPSEDYWRDPAGTESEGPECGWGRVRRQSAILFLKTRGRYLSAYGSHLCRWVAIRG